MRDDERRPRARLRAQQCGELELPLRVDAPGRLVEHEQVGVADEHGREREPLPLAAREVARMARLVAGEPDRGERAPRLRRGRRRARPRRPPARVRGSGPGPGAGTPHARCARRCRPCGSSSPAASFASVVLPQPFGPVSATISPRRSSSDAPSSTRGPSPYANETRVDPADRLLPASTAKLLLGCRVQAGRCSSSHSSASSRGASSRMRPRSRKTTRSA